MSADPHLIDRLRTCLDALPEVLDAYVFGSRARDDAAPASDVDVAVYLAQDAARVPDQAYAAHLAADLMSQLAGPEVDVVVLNSAPPVLYHEVLRDGVRLISRDPRATTTREGYALSRYCDYVPHLAKIEFAHAARIRSGAFGR